jgi:type I restriction enzyme S subunit
MTALKPYPSYRQTDLPWLGQIPAHWEVVRLKWCLSSLESGGRETGGGNQLDSGVFSIGGEHIGWSGKLLLDTPKYISEEYFDSMNQGRIRENDVLLVKDGATIGKTALIKKMPFEKCAINEHVFILRNNSRITPELLGYIMQSKVAQEQIGLEITGSAQPGLSSKFVDTVFVALLPLSEQRTIAAYLDHQTAKIDALIARKERLLDLLAEQRAALISQAVTKGLNPNANMMDSGMAWLGQVPEHWEITRLKHLLQGGFVNGIFKKKEQFGSGVKLVNVTDIYRRDFQIDVESLDRVEADLNELQTYEVLPDDIFFVRSSLKLDGVGVSAYLKQLPEPIVFECHLIRVRPRQNKILSQYLINYLNSSLLRQRIVSLSETTTMTTIAQPKISPLSILVPPINEQRKIIIYIEQQTKRLDELSAKVETAIERLHEYRAALISSAVTGKIQVKT